MVGLSGNCCVRSVARGKSVVKIWGSLLIICQLIKTKQVVGFSCSPGRFRIPARPVALLQRITGDLPFRRSFLATIDMFGFLSVRSMPAEQVAEPG